MSEEKPVAPTMIASRGMRGFLAALFTAGIMLFPLTIFSWAPSDNLPAIFLTTLLIGFVASQIQERMRELSES